MKIIEWPVSSFMGKPIKNVTLDLTDEIVISVEQYYELLQKAKQQTMHEIVRARLNRTQEYLLRVEASKYMVDKDGNPIDLSETPLEYLYGCKVEIV